MTNEKVEVEYITLENNEKYLILKRLTGKNNYIYLSNVKDVKDFFIQKIIIKNNKEYIKNLENKEEFNEALELFKLNQ